MSSTVSLIGHPETLQLSRVLFESRSPKFGSFSVVPSNVSALETALQFATGITPFAVILGPSGWGKTHLLESVAERMHSRGSKHSAMSAIEWLSAAHIQDSSGPLLLDDVIEVAVRPRLRVQLRFALERRVKANRPTFLCMTATKRTRQINQTLPSAQSWNIGTLLEPVPQERQLLISDLAKNAGLSLSTSLTHVLAHQMRGSGSTIVGALNRLRLMGAMWNDVNGTLKALGIMEPFFADNGQWDFARHIIQVGRSFPFERYSVRKEELLAFTMIKEASLSEEHAARALKIQPGVVYQRAQAFEKVYGDSDSAALAARQFAETIINGLVKD